MRLVVAGFLLMLATMSANAGDRYRFRVTREDSNFYKVDGTGFFIRTRYCYEYAMGQEAILVWNGRGSYSNKLIFLDSLGDPKSCDVESLLAETEP